MPLEITLVPDASPTLRAYKRSDGVAQGTPISGTAVGSRSALYEFDLSSLPNGDYCCDISSPLARLYVRKTGSVIVDAGSWVDLDAVTRVATLPAYGESQEWDSGTNQLNVTITKN
jgi:hypothetical protein